MKTPMILLLGCLCGAPHALFAQSNITGSLAGEVKEVVGLSPQSLPGIRVDVIKADTGKWSSAISDENGRYVIKALPAGEYYILANCLNPNLQYETCRPPNPKPDYNGYFSREVSRGERSTFSVHAMQEHVVPVPPVYLKKIRPASSPTRPRAVNPASSLTAPEEEPLAFPLPVETDPSLLADTVPTPDSEALPQRPMQVIILPTPLRPQLVTPTTATRHGTLDADWLTALPLPGQRAVETLAFLVSGVAPAPLTLSHTPGPGLGSGIGTSGQFAVNGLRSRANNFTIDGSDHNDEDIGVRRQGFTTLLPQAVESIQEYQLVTLLPAAQFGRNLGAQVNLVSRTGTPRYHGTAYGFFTNAHLKAREYFDGTGGDAVLTLTTTRNGKTLPVLLDGQSLVQANPVNGEDPFSRSQFGFVMSGPLGKEIRPSGPRSQDEYPTKQQTLFFVSAERQVVQAARESHFAVPTIAERGLFRSGETGLQDPFSTIPRTLFPASLNGNAVFSLFPFPNDPRGPYGDNTFTRILPADARGTIASLRLDRAFGQGGQTKADAPRTDQSVGGRYNFTKDNTVLPVTGGAIASSLRALVQTQNLSLYHVGGSLLGTNEVRFSYGQTRLRFRAVPNGLFPCSSIFGNDPFWLNAPLISNLTGPNSACPADQTCLRRDGRETEELDSALPLLGPLGQLIVSGYSPVGLDVFTFPQRRTNNTFQITDTLFTQQGNHHFVAGLDVRRTHLNSLLDRNFRPLLMFSGAPDIADEFNRVPRSPYGYYLGSDYAAAGAPTGFFQTLALTPDSTIRLRYWQTNFFTSDQFRPHRNLMLTLGLRYEYNTVPAEADKRLESAFTSPAVADLIAAEGPASGLALFLAGRTRIFRADRNNLAPRLSFAWDIAGRGNFTLRGGYGIYYDQIPGAVTSQSRNFFPNFLTINTAGANLANPTTRNLNPFNPYRLVQPGTVNLLNPSLTCVTGEKVGTDLVAFLRCVNRLSTPSVDGQVFPADPGYVLPTANLKTPYAQHWGLTLERAFNGEYLLAVAYVGTRGVHLLRVATPNLGPQQTIVVTNRSGGADSVNLQGFALNPGAGYRRPYPLLGALTTIESDANSTYHSLQVEFSRRVGYGVLFTTTYTWSHVIDEVSDLFELASGPVLPQNSFDRRAERASASFDIRHNFAYGLIWNLSDFGGWLQGWRLASLGTLRSGQPFTLQACCDVNRDGNLSDRLAQTAALLTQQRQGKTHFTLPVPAQTILRQLLAEPGQDGAVRRNTMRGMGTMVMDLALSKDFAFTPRLKLEARLEVFNVFNRTHFGLPVHQLLFPGFGQSVDTRVPARIIQVAGRLSF